MGRYSMVERGQRLNTFAQTIASRWLPATYVTRPHQLLQVFDPPFAFAIPLEALPGQSAEGWMGSVVIDQRQILQQDGYQDLPWNYSYDHLQQDQRPDLYWDQRQAFHQEERQDQPVNQQKDQYHHQQQAPQRERGEDRLQDQQDNEFLDLRHEEHQDQPEDQHQDQQGYQPLGQQQVQFQDQILNLQQEEGQGALQEWSQEEQQDQPGDQQQENPSQEEAQVQSQDQPVNLQQYERQDALREWQQGERQDQQQGEQENQHLDQRQVQPQELQQEDRHDAPQKWQRKEQRDQSGDQQEDQQEYQASDQQAVQLQGQSQELQQEEKQDASQEWQREEQQDQSGDQRQDQPGYQRQGQRQELQQAQQQGIQWEEQQIIHMEVRQDQSQDQPQGQQQGECLELQRDEPLVRHQDDPEELQQGQGQEFQQDQKQAQQQDQQQEKGQNLPPTRARHPRMRIEEWVGPSSVPVSKARQPGKRPAESKQNKQESAPKSASDTQGGPDSEFEELLVHFRALTASNPAENHVGSASTVQSDAISSSPLQSAASVPDTVQPYAIPSGSVQSDANSSGVRDSSVSVGRRAAEAPGTPHQPNQGTRPVAQNGAQIAAARTHNALSAQPQPTPLSLRARHFLQPLVGIDLTDIRVHRGIVAEQLTTAYRADAITVGNEVAIANGYADDTPETLGLLAHEFTHLARRSDPRFVPPVVRSRSLSSATTSLLPLMPRREVSTFVSREVMHTNIPRPDRGRPYPPQRYAPMGASDRKGREGTGRIEASDRKGREGTSRIEASDRKGREGTSRIEASDRKGRDEASSSSTLRNFDGSGASTYRSADEELVPSWSPVVPMGYPAQADEEGLALQVESQVAQMAQVQVEQVVPFNTANTNTGEHLQPTGGPETALTVNPQFGSWGGLPAPWEPMPDWLDSLPSTNLSDRMAEVQGVVPMAPVREVVAYADHTGLQAGAVGTGLAPVSTGLGVGPVPTGGPGEVGVQRAAEERSLGGDGGLSMAPGESPAVNAPEPDLDALAQQVHAILKKRLAAEQRRSHR